MLLSRTQLQGWRPDALSTAATTLGNAGETVYVAVRKIANECNQMPENKVWSGPAHSAANEMFTRAATSSSQFSHYTEAIAKAMVEGGPKLAAAGDDLLNHSDEVENSGELSVNDFQAVCDQ